MGHTEAWTKLLEVQRLIQTHFPECVLVGGTAAALHAHHRFSLDVDSVLTDLRERFPEVVEKLEGLAGWRTNRLNPPKLILGNFEGVDVGIRQLIRSQPLETTTIEGIRVPTLAEMVRVKGWLVATRNAVRDFLDFCALADAIGSHFEAAMKPMDTLYPQEGSMETTTRHLYKMLAEPRPYDLKRHDTRLSRYQGLQPPWNDFPYVEAYSRHLALRLMNARMGL